MGVCPVRAFFLFLAPLALAQTNGPDDDRRRAAELVAASDVASTRGQYDEVIKLLGQAVELHMRLGDQERVAEDWNGIGRAQVYKGAYPAAVHSFEKALAIDRSRGDAQGETVRLYNIGNAYFEQGRYSEAFQHYQASVERVKSAGAADWVPRRRQIATSNLAILYQRLGRYQQALELYQSLRADSQAMKPDEEAQLVANQGTLYRRLGDPAKALEAYRAAQRLFSQQRHPFGEINVLRNIGIVQALDLNQFQQALDSFAAARRLAESSGAASQTPSLALYIAGTLKELGRMTEARAEFGAALAGARKVNGRESEWRALFGLGQLEQAAGRDADALRYYAEAIAGIESVRSDLGIAALRRDFLADKRQVYDAAIALRVSLSPPPVKEIFELMERSRSRLLQDSLQRPTLEAVQARLPEGALLLEYWVGPREGAVLAITRDSATLTPRVAIDVEPLREAAFSGGEWRTPAREAGAALLGGLRGLEQAPPRNVIIVPDGALSLLPFELLEVPASGGLLIEKAPVTYLPSASLLLRRESNQSAGLAPPWRNQLLALADPEHPGAGPFSGGKPLERLPKALEEVRYAAGLLPGRAEIHTGAEATKPPLVSAAGRGFSLLHLATHATADYTDPERSRILLASPKLNQAADFLFLREIYALDLKGCDLVVLSACETDTGKLISGEGVEGFGKAFLTAGARSAISTLWRVGDAASAEFMKQFYHALADGQPKAEALRQAKLAFLGRQGELAHPRYWAAYVLSGDGFSPIPRHWSWRWPVFGLAAVAAAILTARSIR